MRLRLSVFIAFAANAAVCAAQSTERNLAPPDRNPACMERNVDANSPGCLTNEPASTGRIIAIPPATQPVTAPASESQPAPGLKPAPTLPPVGETPLVKPTPNLPPAGQTPLTTPAPNLPAAGPQSPPAVPTPPAETPRATPTPKPAPAGKG